MLEALQALVDAPIVCLAEAFMRFVRDGNECVLTVGTWDKPGWTNQDHFPPAAFDYLAAMAPSGGCLVDFVDRATARPRKGAGDQLGGYPPPGRRGARACDARPSPRAAHPAAGHPPAHGPGGDQQAQPRPGAEKYGQDYRARVYLKQQLVRKKAVADALVQFRKRDRESYSFWDPKEPLFRAATKAPSGRSVRMGTREIEALLERYARRALKALPTAPAAPEPLPLPPPPPAFPGPFPLL